MGSRFISSIVGILIGENFTQWNLVIYPNVKRAEETHIGLFLIYKGSDSSKFTTSYKLGITVSGKSTCCLAEGETSGKEFSEGGKNNGPGKFRLISHDELFNEYKDLIMDGKLTFFCDLTITALEKDTKVPKKVSTNKICDDFKKMFDNELFTDFELRTKDGKKLKAHKAIMAARSPMVYAMLSNDMKKANENVVVVPDFDHVVMKEVLRFIYYNEVENMSKLVHDLINAAEKYQLEELKDLCLGPIISSLTVDNAVKSLLIADRVSNTKNLFDECLNFIMSNFDVISKTAEWKELPSSVTTKIIQTMNFTYLQGKIFMSSIDLLSKPAKS